MKGFILSVFVFCAIVAAGKFTALLCWILLNLQFQGATIYTLRVGKFHRGGRSQSNEMQP